MAEGDNTEQKRVGIGSRVSEAAYKLGSEITKFHNEYVWPLFSLIATVKPIHALITANRVKLEKGDKALEVGAGYPFYKIYSNRVGEEGVFVSLDINPNIQKRNKKIGYWLNHVLGRKKDEDLLVADAGKLPFSDSSFDVVIASNFTSSLLGNQEYIKEAYRVLKPGGRFISAFLEVLIYPYQSKRNAKACREIGFEDVKIRAGAPAVLTLMGYHSLIERDALLTLIASGISWNWDVIAKKPLNPDSGLNSKVVVTEH